MKTSTLGLALALVITATFAAPPIFGAPQATTSTPAAEANPPLSVTLRLKETTVLAPPAPNAFAAGTKCDSDGDVFLKLAYYEAASGRIDADPGVSELIPESKRVVGYGQSPLSSSDYPNAALRSFNVTNTGVVYALISTRRDAPQEGPRPPFEYYVERFKDDGTTDSIAHIGVPPGATRWNLNLIGAFRDGNLLVAGTASFGTDPGQSSASSRRPFTAIYDPSGRFVRELTLPDDVVNELANNKGSVQQSTKAEPPAAAGNAAEPSAGTEKDQTAASRTAQASAGQSSTFRESFDTSIVTGGLVNAPDGNIWVMRASDPLRLYAISAGGEIVKHFQFSPPASGLKPFEFGPAGPDQFFIKFARFAGTPGTMPSAPSELLGVFNTVSERFETLYARPEGEKGFRVLACSDGRGGFFYLGGTPDNHLAIYDYIP